MSLYSSSEDDTADDPYLFTPWSGIHALSGFVAAHVLYILFPKKSITFLFLVWLLIHTIYELKDIIISYGYGKRDQSFLNSIGDTIATIIGFFLYHLIAGTLTKHNKHHENIKSKKCYKKYLTSSPC
jgi:hypothetical protein